MTTQTHIAAIREALESARDALPEVEKREGFYTRWIASPELAKIVDALTHLTALESLGGGWQPIGYTGSGSISSIKSGGEGHIWAEPGPAHPIPLYLAAPLKSTDENSAPIKCSKCDGYGWYEDTQPNFHTGMPEQVQAQCHYCRSTGYELVRPPLPPAAAPFTPAQLSEDEAIKAMALADYTWEDGPSGNWENASPEYKERFMNSARAQFRGLLSIANVTRKGV